MPIETTPWNIDDQLDSEEMIAAYLEALAEETDPAVRAVGLADVERARARLGQLKSGASN